MGKKVDRLNIFVAGAKNLDTERNAIRATLMRQQTLFQTMVETKTFEDFIDSLSNVCRQEEYNHYISEIADVVFFVFDSRVGNITLAELDIAIDTFKSKKKPKIFVCINADGLNAQSNDILTLKQHLATNKLKWQEYTSIDQLSKICEDNFSEYFLSQMLTPTEKKILEGAYAKFAIYLTNWINNAESLSSSLGNLSSRWEDYCNKRDLYSSKFVQGSILSSLTNGLRRFADSISHHSELSDIPSLNLTEEEILLLSKFIDLQNIAEIPDAYRKFFDQMMTVVKEFTSYIKEADATGLPTETPIINFKAVAYLTNGFYYTCLVYACKLPEKDKSLIANSTQFSRYLPRTVSLNLEPADYRRFAKQEYELYERSLITDESQLINDMFIKLQPDANKGPQIVTDKPTCPCCGYAYSGSPKFCTNCGTKLTSAL